MYKELCKYVYTKQLLRVPSTHMSRASSIMLPCACHPYRCPPSPSHPLPPQHLRFPHTQFPVSCVLPVICDFVFLNISTPHLPVWKAKWKEEEEEEEGEGEVRPQMKSQNSIPVSVSSALSWVILFVVSLCHLLNLRSILIYTSERGRQKRKSDYTCKKMLTPSVYAS